MIVRCASVTCSIDCATMSRSSPTSQPATRNGVPSMVAVWGASAKRRSAGRSGVVEVVTTEPSSSTRHTRNGAPNGRPGSRPGSGAPPFGGMPDGGRRETVPVSRWSIWAVRSRVANATTPAATTR